MTEVLSTYIDRAVAALAERQHGVISTAQLVALGMGRDGIDLRVRQGRLHRVHRGVYAVGHKRLTYRGRLWAAVLACGGPEHAALSHRSAASVWDIASGGKVIDVTTFGRSAAREGINVHRSTTLNPVTDVVRQPDGLPLTTAMRTLADLAGTLNATQLRRAARRAELHRLLDVKALPQTGKGARKLKQAVGLVEEPQITNSELEERFLDLVAEAGLPQPSVNTQVEGYKVDFAWRRERLIVETDGRAAHLTAEAFEADRERDVELRIAGWTVVRFTWRQVVEEPEKVVARLRALFRAAAREGAPPAIRRAA